MKIIDLLNKIANKEEVPKKIKVHNTIYEWKYKEEAYWWSSEDGDIYFAGYEGGEENETYDNFLFPGIENIEDFLNTEFEIID